MTLEHVLERTLSRLTEVSIDSGDAKATITINDYTALPLDTVTVTIGGVAHVLTEGTDWHRGASNAAAATSLAVAIDALTGVSAEATADVVWVTAPANITSLAVSDAVNMTLVDSSLITIYDPSKNWGIDMWENAIVEVEVDGVHYYRTIASNTATTLTIATLPAGHPVAAGAHYNIRLSTRIATISGQVVQISGQAVKISGQTVVVQSGSYVMADISGQVVQVSGQAVKISGQTVVVRSGSYVMADISGETIIAKISGQIVYVSGQPVKISGQTVIAKISGQIVKISGQTVVVQSGSYVMADISGQVVQISGQAVHVSSGHIHVSSGQVIAKVSGEVMEIVLPTEFKTGLIRWITSASGGEVLHSGAVKAAQVKSLATNSGVIAIGGENDRPWYMDTCSGLGFVLDPGEVKSEDIDNFSRIYVVAQVSGDQISFAGVN